MKSKILFLVALLFGLFNYAMAQCPPWNTPASFSTCAGDVVPAVNLPTGYSGKVLILGGDVIDSHIEDVKTHIISVGAFTQVDIFNAGNGTPTLAYLSNYDAVLVFDITGFNNSTLLGNTLASYIDGGGGVVLANGWGTFIQGNFASDVYRVTVPSGNTTGPAHVLGTVHLPSHPIMSGVASFSGGDNVYRSTSTALSTNSYRIADWDDGRFLITAKDNVGPTNAKRVDLNFDPVSFNSHGSSSWLPSTDGAKIMSNSLKYVMRSPFQWTNNNPAIGLATSGYGNIPSFTASNTGTSPISATVTVTALPLPQVLSFDENGRKATYSNVSINGGGNSAVVAPGSSNTLFFDANSVYTGYCSGCIYQQYIGIGSTGATILCASYQGTATENYQANNIAFTAPTTPGIYYLTFATTLDYLCVPVSFPNDLSRAIAVIYVGVPQQCQYTITVNPKPIVSVSQPAPVCEPNTIDLSNTVNANIQVNYTFHNADYSPRSNTVISTVADSQKFYVIGTTSSGCSDTETVYVTINPKPVVVTHNPTAQCAPSTVNLTSPAVTAGSTAGLNYSYWLNAAATQPLSNATAVTNTGSKLYYLVGTTNKGCTDTTNVMVTFYNKPNVVAYNPPAACTGSSVNIKTAATTYGSTANLTYTYWNSANQNITATANAITVGGSYSIVGANSAGCKDTATVTVTFNNCGGIMSGNNSNQSNNEMEQNGLGKLQQILVKLYPNPASNVLYFEYEAYQSGTVASFITDATGRTVRQQQFQSNSAGVQKFDVDVQSLPAGMYYFHFQLPESKENKTIKFVINK